jgi:hypothetical protein
MYPVTIARSTTHIIMGGGVAGVSPAQGVVAYALFKKT